MLFNQDIYHDLNSYLGIEPGNGTPITDKQVLQAMNKGLQKVYTKGPFYLRRQPGAANFPVPATVSLNVTQGSTVITGFTGWTPQMQGCCIRIEGEPGDNELIDQNTLVVPIMQATGQNLAATVYFNCFTMPVGATSVAGDVFLDGWRQLDPLFYEEHQIFADTHSREFLDYSGAYILTNNAYLRLKVGVPTGYYVRPVSFQTGQRWQNQIRMFPMPCTPHTITWVSEMSAPPLTLAMLDLPASQGDEFPTPTQFITLPGDCHEASWLPLARMALSANPHFLESKRAYVATEAAEALDFLTLLSPQRQTGAMLRARTLLPN